MPVIKLETLISAPISRLFDLSRSIELHAKSTSITKERAVEGRTTGLLKEGETVTWEAIHFGVRQRLTSKIVIFDRPTHFRDSMQDGIFQRLDHDHFFKATKKGIQMKDVFDYESPLGVLGRLADSLFLENYLKRFLINRNLLIKKIAESEEWKRFL